MVLPCLQEDAVSFRQAVCARLLAADGMQPLVEAMDAVASVVVAASDRLENAKDGVIAIAQERIEVKIAAEAAAEAYALEVQASAAKTAEIDVRQLSGEAELNQAWQIYTEANATTTVTDFAIDKGQQVRPPRPARLNCPPPAPLPIDAPPASTPVLEDRHP